jgi:hypothetical protein
MKGPPPFANERMAKMEPRTAREGKCGELQQKCHEVVESGRPVSEAAQVTVINRDNSPNPCGLSMQSGPEGPAMRPSSSGQRQAAWCGGRDQDRSLPFQAAAVPRRQRDGVSRVRGPRAGDRHPLLLLRDAAPCVGTRDQREHQRPTAAVPAQAPEHGAPHPARLQSDCGSPQPTSPQAAGLPHPGGMLWAMTFSVALQS